VADAAVPSVGYMIDPYATLGLTPGADRAAIRAAYRRLAREYHPDLNRSPGAASRMRAINEAYSALSGAGDVADGSPAPETPAAVAFTARVHPTPAVAEPMPIVPGPPSHPFRYAYRTVPPAPGRRVDRPSWTPSTAPTREAAHLRRNNSSIASAGPATTAAVTPPQAGSPARPAVIGAVAGCCALVALLAAWAFAAARPVPAVSVTALPANSTGTALAETSGTTSQAAATENRIAVVAAQASANAAANAKAAQQNVESRGVASGAGRSVTLEPGDTKRRAAAPFPAATGARADSSGSPAPAAPLAPLAVSGTSSTAGTGRARNASPAPSETGGAPDTGAVLGATVTLPEETRSPTRASVLPSIPVVPAATGRAHVQAVSSPAGDPALVAVAANRALSNYDKAWTNYLGALRSAGATSLIATSPASSRVTSLAPSGASIMLSGETHLAMTRALYLQQQIAWNQQASAVLAASATEGARAPTRPDSAKAAQAELRLRRVAEMVSQAQVSGGPVPAEARDLLQEAERLHREWVADWAKLIAAAE
jgi:hypothetical protein